MRNIIVICCLIGITISCNSDVPPPDGSGDFGRRAMLINWADNIIVPAYQAFVADMSGLRMAATTFTKTTTEANLVALRSAWLEAYISWQRVSMFEIGKAEELTFRNFMNVYPVNASDVDASVLSGSYDLTSVNNQDEQGFAALDYLINGKEATDAAIVAIFADAPNGSKYKTFLTDVTDRMSNLTGQVVTHWTTGYRDTFVNNTGTETTGSLNKIVNAYLFYYEKVLRANKIGIPAGVFSRAPLSDRVEAFYKGDASKILFNVALDAIQDFFNGKHFGNTTTGESMKSYLDLLNTIKNGEDLATLINNQFNSARTTTAVLSDNFADQVTNDNIKMLMTYDQLQANVVLLKVDMLQAFGIKVDFVDADGD